MSRKNFGAIPGLYPMPVLIVATYNEKGEVNVMTAAWGQMCHSHKVALFLDKAHKSSANIERNKAFTVSITDLAHLKEANFFGTISGYDMPDKFARTGMKAEKSKYVNAPVLPELPTTMECTVEEIIERDYMYCVIGNIVNTSADRSVLGEDGKVDPRKLQAVIYDEFGMSYYFEGEKLGQTDLGVDYL